jgi:hypothetical protein
MRANLRLLVRKVHRLSGIVACALLLAAFPRDVAVADSSLVSSAALTNVSALGVTPGSTPVYVATSRGLFRSANSGLTRWERMSADSDVTQVSPNPAVLGDIVYATAKGIFHSTDGGRTATRTFNCAIGALARAPGSPRTLYATTRADRSSCPFILVNDNPVQAILRSVNDGVTWSVAYRPTGYNTAGLFYTPIAIDPANPNHVVAGHFDTDYGSVGVATTTGVGRPWQGLMDAPIQGTVPRAIVFDPGKQHDLWIAWGGSCPGQLDRNNTVVLENLLSAASPSALAFDPLTSRAYLTASSNCGGQLGPSYLYAVDRSAGDYVRGSNALPGSGDPSPYLAITSSGFLLTAGAAYPGSSEYGGPLVVRKLNAPGFWSRALFLPASTVQGLGGVISAIAICDNQPCQYFEKGAVVKTGNRIVPVPLVTNLFAGAGAKLPVGGTTSTVTYGDLAALRTKRTAPPVGSHGGVVVGSSGTFVPFSATLGAGSGYIVPPYFWQFLTNGHNLSGGWLQTIGLPLTPAVQATVTKGALGRRTIMIQAFQYAVLTYDPRNPPSSRVERANIGSDFAAAFPSKTR